MTLSITLFVWVYIKDQNEKEFKILVTNFVTDYLDLNGKNRRILQSVPVKFIDGKTILVDKQIDYHYGSFIRHKTLSDPELVEKAYSELKSALAMRSEAILIDIGAHTGSFALLPVLNKNIYVIAFEPNYTTASILQNNVNYNGLENNVKVIPIGLSDKDDVLILNMPMDRRSGLATFGKNLTRFRNENTKSQLAVVKRLDDVIEPLLPKDKKIDVIKIDTEGWEYYVLLGGKSTIEKHRPMIIMEHQKINMRQTGVNPTDLLRLLQDLKYDCSERFGDQLCYPRKQA